MYSPPVSTHHVLSQDGTSIGYLTQGTSGPSIILISGAMQLASTYSHLSSHLELSTSTSSNFIIHSPDRRGRGLSPKPYSSTSHDISIEVQDVLAVMQATSCTRIFGLSSGAMVALELARTFPGALTHVAVYEPPFYPEEGEGKYDYAGIERLGKEIEKGDLSNALVTALLTAQTAPTLFRILPRSISNLLAKGLITINDWWNRSRGVEEFRGTFSSLLPGILYDFHIVSQISKRSSPISSFSSLSQLPSSSHSTKILLISGTASQKYLRDGVRELGGVIQGAQVVEMEGLDHGGPWDSGKPEVLARVLSEFYS